MLKDFQFILTRYIYLIPPIQMLLLLVIALIELVSTYRISDELLFVLGVKLGNSWATLLVYFVLFFSNKFKYCSFTKMMVIALVINQILYEVQPYIGGVLYDKVYTIMAFIMGIVMYWSILYKQKK